MRVMGSETEYGIHAPSAPGANATMMSARVIQAYAQVTRQRAAGGAETRWDYTDEEPLHDARGWTLERGRPTRSQLTDQPPVLDAEAVALAYGREELEPDGEDESGTLLMNMVLGNGARLYVDHAHPEYSSPEVTNPARRRGLGRRRGPRGPGCGPPAGQRPGTPAGQPVQEQHGQQVRLLRLARELPDAPLGAVRRDRAAG